VSSLLTQVPPQLPTGDCKIAFVGDFPRDHERLHGLPLCGAEGRTFDQILRIAGLASADTSYPVPERARRIGKMVQARSPYLITNVFNEQPPGDDIAAWCAAAPERKTWEGYDLPLISGKGYLRPGFLWHLERLTSELQSSRPNLIVPLGQIALWALTGLSDITLARGAVSTASYLVPGMKLLPTFAPLHIQKEWRLFHVAVTDLIKAAAQAEFPEVRLVSRKIHIRPSLADLRVWETRLLAADRLSVDIETAKQQITCIGFAPSAAEAFVIPFADYESPSRSYWDTAEAEAIAWGVVRRLCESAIPKTLQNGMYDAYYLVRQMGIWLRNYDEDTRLQHHALYPELPKSLAFMGATYGDFGNWKTMAQHRMEKKDA
jgi:uracil-DNA glycosylase